MRKLNGLSLIIISFLTLAFVAFAAPAKAFDLTLRVPVELVNMPVSITGGMVSCKVYGADRTTRVIHTDPLLGSGTTNFSIRGRFTSNVDVIIRNNVNFPSSGLGWTCVLFLYDSKVGSQTIGGTPAGVIMSKYAVDTSKPVKYEVSGIR